MLTAHDGQTVCVRTSQDGTVEHIGIPLFPAQLRSLQPSPVYDFLEFAVLNKRCKIDANQLYLNKVIFKKGNWNSLATSRLDECQCSITNQDDRLYIVNWQRDGRDVAIIGIPIEYELLSNDTRRRMERDFIRLLEQHRCNADNRPKLMDVSESDLKIYGTGGLFVHEGKSYMLPELNQNSYYVLTTIYEEEPTVVKGKTEITKMETVVPAIVISEEYPAETLANLLMGESGRVPDAQLTIDFHLSDYHRQKLTIPVSQFSDYCRQQRCNVYYASRGTTKGVTEEGTLFLHNKEFGYCHLLSIKAPISQLTAHCPQLTADAYIYIPPVEKTGLFGKTPTKKSGAKIY